MKKATIKKGKSPSKEQRSDISQVFAVSAVLLLGLVAYSNSFVCGYHLDDLPHIVNNKLIEVFDVGAIWNNSHNRFLPMLSFALNYQLHGTDVVGYHVFNLIFHLINALLVMGLVRTFFDTPNLKTHSLFSQRKSIALFAGLLFVSHPLATQSVTYVIQRMASMMSLFYLLTMYLYLKGRLAAGSRSVGYIAGAIVSGWCAFVSKENSYTLPLSIALLEMLFFHAFHLKVVVKNFRFWMAAIALVGFGIFAFASFGSAIKTLPPAFMNEYREITPLAYLLTQFTVIPKYLQLLLLPVSQNLDYDWPLYSSFSQWPVLLGFLFLLALVVWALFQWKKNPLYTFGILFFLLTLSIESGIVPIDDLIFEHRTYLPSFGIFCLVSAGVHTIFSGQRKVWLNRIILGSTLLLTLLTYQRNKVWKDEETLWTNVISHSPEKTRPRNCRGSFYHQHQRYAEAVADYTAAIQRRPKFYEAYYNRAMTYKALNDNSAALNDYKIQLQLMPEMHGAILEIIELYKKEGQYQDALVYSNQIIALEPDNADHYLIKGQLYKQINNPLAALECYEIAITKKGNKANAYYNKGALLQELNRNEEAYQDYSAAISFKKDYTEAYVNRANISRDQGQFEAALSDYAKAIQINPSFEKAYANRGYLYQRKNDFRNAITDLTSAIRIVPNYDRALYARGVCFYKVNQLDSACQDLRQAASLGNAQAAPLLPQICMQ